ncbi:MAG: hypothetical protein ACK5BV_07825 [Bacteroidota bacterium]|jgi:hypothetical protein
MKKNNTLFLILCLLLLQSCSKNNNNDNASPAPTGGYSWSCKINGIAYSWSGNSGVNGEGSGVCQYNPMTDAFSIGMSTTKPNTNNLVLSMLFPEYKKNTYILDGLVGQSKQAANLTFTNPQQSYYTSGSNKITLIINDALNDKISGTFFGSLFLAFPIGTGSVTVTEGKFSLQKY